MYEWFPAGVVAFLTAFAFVGDAVESGKVAALRRRFRRRPPP